jgi:hypothetical protein
MSAPITMERLLVLRRLTRALEANVGAWVRGHAAALAPLLRPRPVLGEFVQSPGRESPLRPPDRVWKEVETLYEAIAPHAPFHVARDLRPPVDIPGTTLELAPLEYVHDTAGPDTRRITVTKPFQWIVSYSGAGPALLRELVADKNRDAAELQRLILVTLVLHVVLKQQPAVAAVFADLRMPLETRRRAEFGDLPVTVLASAVPTIRPADEVVVQSTEMTGTSTFQEVIDLDGLAALPDPVRVRVADVLAAHGETLPPR